VAKSKAIRKYKKRKPTLNHQLSRILRQREYSPLTDILNQLDLLEPKDRVAVGFKIMEFLYPRPKAVETGRVKKTPANQLNVQINAEKPKVESLQSHSDMVKLLEAAEGKDD